MILGRKRIQDALSKFTKQELAEALREKKFDFAAEATNEQLIMETRKRNLPELLQVLQGLKELQELQVAKTTPEGWLAVGQKVKMPTQKSFGCSFRCFLGEIPSFREFLFITDLGHIDEGLVECAIGMQEDERYMFHKDDLEPYTES